MYSSAAVSIPQILLYPLDCQNMPGFLGADNEPENQLQNPVCFLGPLNYLLYKTLQLPPFTNFRPESGLAPTKLQRGRAISVYASWLNLLLVFLQCFQNIFVTRLYQRLLRL